VPRTFSRSAPNGWRYRGIVGTVLRREWSATSNCGHGGVLRGWDTTTSTRRLALPRWHRAPHHRHFGEPEFGPGVSWAASTLLRPQLDVADHSEVMTPRRLRDTTDRAVCADKVCGALSLALQRLSIVATGPARHPGRATASSQPSAERRAATAAGSGRQPQYRVPAGRLPHHHLEEIVGCDRVAEQPALAVLTAAAHEELSLLLRFDALGHDL